jgi:hypothetical protein
MNSSQALVGFDRPLTPANANDADLAQRCARLEAELRAMEPVVAAAVLVVTSFRLRDEAGLIDTLRLLTESVVGLEEQEAGGED